MSRTYHHVDLSRHWRPNKSPSWWRKCFMLRSQRREEKRLCDDLAKGRRDADATPMPLGSRKPHVYYW